MTGAQNLQALLQRRRSTSQSVIWARTLKHIVALPPLIQKALIKSIRVFKVAEQPDFYVINWKNS